MNYLITGSTGLIGRILIETILKEHVGDMINFVLPVRDVKRARKLFDHYRGEEKVRIIYVECDLLQMTRECFDMGFHIDYLIHCAAPTVSAYMVSNPVETADAIVLGTRRVLDVARDMKVSSMVFLSSMEVYGIVADDGKCRREEELGKIDLESSRSCYPMGKRMAEHYCHIYQKEYAVPVKIARLSQVFGKGVREGDNRVFMQLARAALEKKDIILRTWGRSFGNYCATEDAVKAILLILERGTDGETYNVVNEDNTMTIWEMARLVADKLAFGQIDVKIQLEDSQKTGYAPDTALRLSSEKLRMLGWKATKSLEEMYADVLKEMRLVKKQD